MVLLGYFEDSAELGVLLLKVLLHRYLLPLAVVVRRNVDLVLYS